MERLGGIIQVYASEYSTCICTFETYEESDGEAGYGTGLERSRLLTVKGVVKYGKWRSVNGL